MLVGYAYADDMARVIGQYDLIYGLHLPTDLVADILHGGTDSRGYASVPRTVEQLLHFMQR